MSKTENPSPQTNLSCERCQGNGEIVTDWERYKHPHKGDVGDEAVAECPDCNGTGELFGHADDCHDDLCALNGDMHSCAGKVEPCGCTAPPETRALVSPPVDNYGDSGDGR